MFRRYESITVQELIDNLKSLDPKAEVVFRMFEDDESDGGIGEVVYYYIGGVMPEKGMITLVCSNDWPGSPLQ